MGKKVFWLLVLALVGLIGLVSTVQAEDSVVTAPLPADTTAAPPSDTATAPPPPPTDQNYPPPPGKTNYQPPPPGPYPAPYLPADDYRYPPPNEGGNDGYRPPGSVVGPDGGGQGEDWWQQQNQERLRREAAMRERELRQVEKRVQGFRTKGVIIPTEVETALGQAKTLLEQMKSGTLAEDFDPGELGDYFQTVYENMQTMEMAAQFPRMLKDANRILSQQKKALSRAEAKAGRLKIDVGALLSEWRGLVSGAEQAVAEAGQLQSSDLETAMDVLRDQVFEGMQDIGEKQRAFEMVSNTGQMMKQTDREIKKAESMIARLKRQGKNTAELEQLLAEGKSQLATIRSLISQANVDPDELVQSIETAQDTQQRFFEALSEVTGQSYDFAGPQMPGFGPGPAPMGPPAGGFGPQSYNTGVDFLVATAEVAVEGFKNFLRGLSFLP